MNVGFCQTSDASTNKKDGRGNAPPVAIRLGILLVGALTLAIAFFAALCHAGKKPDQTKVVEMK